MSRARKKCGGDPRRQGGNSAVDLAIRLAHAVPTLHSEGPGGVAPFRKPYIARTNQEPTPFAGPTLTEAIADYEHTNPGRTVTLWCPSRRDAVDSLTTPIALVLLAGGQEPAMCRRIAARIADKLIDRVGRRTDTYEHAVPYTVNRADIVAAMETAEADLGLNRFGLHLPIGIDGDMPGAVLAQMLSPTSIMAAYGDWNELVALRKARDAVTDTMPNLHPVMTSETSR